MSTPSLLSLNASNFASEVIESALPVLVDFSATWCGPCKTLGPVVEKFAEEHSGVYKVGAVDIDISSDLAQKFGIRSVPTLLVFKQGHVTAQHVGVTNREGLLALLAK